MKNKPKNNNVYLPAAIARLRAEHGIEIGYRALYTRCLSNQVPGATRGPNGRWLIPVEALPEIADTLRSRSA